MGAWVVAINNRFAPIIVRNRGNASAAARPLVCDVTACRLVKKKPAVRAEIEKRVERK
jgi:hypothetical protein